MKGPMTGTTAADILSDIAPVDWWGLNKYLGT